MFTPLTPTAAAQVTAGLRVDDLTPPVLIQNLTVMLQVFFCMLSVFNKGFGTRGKCTEMTSTTRKKRTREIFVLISDYVYQLGNIIAQVDISHMTGRVCLPVFKQDMLSSL